MWAWKWKNICFGLTILSSFIQSSIHSSYACTRITISISIYTEKCPKTNSSGVFSANIRLNKIFWWALLLSWRQVYRFRNVALTRPTHVSDVTLLGVWFLPRTKTKEDKSKLPFLKEVKKHKAFLCNPRWLSLDLRLLVDGQQHKYTSWKLFGGTADQESWQGLVSRDRL